jgi:hypothetical protein
MKIAGLEVEGIIRAFRVSFICIEKDGFFILMAA